MKLQGSCLCGSVQYSASSEPVLTAFCHCRNCQKAGGAGYSANVAIASDALAIQGDVSRYGWTGGSGGTLTRSFCPNCGSPVAIEAEALPGVTLIQAGGLEDAGPIEPVMHIWCASAQPWDHIPPSANRVEGAPAAAS